MVQSSESITIISLRGTTVTMMLDQVPNLSVAFSYDLKKSKLKGQTKPPIFWQLKVLNGEFGKKSKNIHQHVMMSAAKIMA